MAKRELGAQHPLYQHYRNLPDDDEQPQTKRGSRPGKDHSHCCTACAIDNLASAINNAVTLLDNTITEIREEG